MSNMNPGQFRDRLQKRMEDLRSRSPMKGERIMSNRAFGERAGGGSLLDRARSRMDKVTARIQERKPGLMPKVQEFRPGSRIKQILAPQVSPVSGNPSDLSDSSMGDKSYQRHNSQISVEM